MIVSINALREYLNQPYRRLMIILYEKAHIAEIMGLGPSRLPHYSTVCARKQPLKVGIWRRFLSLTIELHDSGEIQASDPTGMDHIAASQLYAKRTKYNFKAVKSTAQVERKTGCTLDIHCSVIQPRDSQVGWQVLLRNLDNISTNKIDKEDDW